MVPPPVVMEFCQLGNLLLGADAWDLLRRIPCRARKPWMAGERRPRQCVLAYYGRWQHNPDDPGR